MAIYIASPEQKQIFESKASLLNVNYRELETALDCIALQIRYRILENQTVLVVVPDQKAKTLLETKIKELQLDMFMLSVTSDAMPDKSDFKQLQEKLNPSDHPSMDLTTQIQSYNRAKEEITSSLRQKYTNPTQKPTWRQLIDDFCELQVEMEVLLINRWLDSSTFNMDDEELNSLMETIAEAQMYYHSEFEIKDYSLLNHELNKNISEHSKLKSTVSEISRLLNEGEQIKNKFLLYSRDLENSFLNKHLTIIHRLKADTDLIKTKISQWLSVQSELNKPLIPGFQSEKQKIHAQEGRNILTDTATLFNKIHELTHTHIPIPNKIILSLVQSCAEVNTILDKYRSELNIRKVEYLKSVNMHNHLDPKLRALEDELNDLTKQINEAAFLNEKLEINTLSFTKHTDIIIALVRKLSLIRREAEQSMYYLEWKHFYQKQSNKEQIVLHALRNMAPEKWLSTIKGWYLYHHITQDQNHLQSTTLDQLSDLKDLYIHKKNLQTLEAIRQHSQLIPKKLKGLKTADTKLYKLLTSDKGHPNSDSWKNLLEYSYDNIEDFFPIIIVDQDHLDKLKHSDNRKLIVINHRDSNLNIMQLFNSITYYWDENHAVEEAEYRLNLSANTSNFKDLKITDRLPLFRTISQMLMTLPRLPEIYMIKDSCILSFASPYINQKLISTLYSHGIKKVLPEPTPVKAMSGAFLEASNDIYCLTEDALPCPTDSESVLWQYQILETMKHAGFQIINIDTSELFNNQKHIDNLIESIKLQQNAHLKSDEIQKSIEFT